MSLDVGNDGKTGFFAVFDGHGGKEVAKFVALKMVGIFGCSSSANSVMVDICLGTGKLATH